MVENTDFHDPKITNMPSTQATKFFADTKNWLINQERNYFDIREGKVIVWGDNSYLQLSPPLKFESENITEDSIYLFQQFYINSNEERQREIRKTLKYNSLNKNINKIYLLNERHYTDEELGVKSDKIIQIVINKRLMYSDIMNFVNEYGIEGYIIISNSDIFFDASVINLKKSILSRNKTVLCQSRYNFEIDNLKYSEIDSGARPDSQDTWIYHSDHNPEKQFRKLFKVPLGKPGCDNKITYLFMICGYECFNEPTKVKSYHYHRIQVRNYTVNSEKVGFPHYAIYPRLTDGDVYILYSPFLKIKK